MSLIEVKNLTFEYFGSQGKIFDNVSFNIDTNYKLGLIGRNGIGKTTLFNIFMGNCEYKGEINHSVKFEYFPYVVENQKENTIEIIKNISKIEVDKEWLIYKEINMLKLKDDILERPFETLSEGERLKVLLLSLFIKENTFLLIDEPTNHLDYYGRKIVGEYLSKKKGFILISHDRNFLDNTINYVMAINKATIQVQKGNYSSWALNKSYEDSFLLAQNGKLNKEIGRMQNSISKVSSYSHKAENEKKSSEALDKGFLGHKSAKIMKRAKSIDTRRRKLVEEKKGLLKDIERDDELTINCEDYFKNILIYVKNLSLYYGEREIINSLNITIENGDIVHLKGQNGSGKSSFIKLILGQNIKYEGEYNIGSNIKISYVPQDIDHLKGSLKEYIIENVEDETKFKVYLRKLGFSRELFDRNLETYSTGQKKKVLIAKSICENANIYIWDEPLNGVDINSRIQIQNMVENFKPTLLLIEHDKAFTDSVATKSINFHIDELD